MEIILKTDLGDCEKDEDYKPTEEEIKEELTQVLFEVCEDWVLRGQVPLLVFKELNKERKKWKKNVVV